jgi:hypothetical protein
MEIGHKPLGNKRNDYSIHTEPLAGEKIVELAYDKEVFLGPSVQARLSPELTGVNPES